MSPSCCLVIGAVGAESLLPRLGFVPALGGVWFPTICSLNLVLDDDGFALVEFKSVEALERGAAWPSRLGFVPALGGVWFPTICSLNLVLDDDGFALVEFKSVEALERGAAWPFPRFVRESDGWHWPSAEKAAADLGLTFRMFTSEQVNPIWIRNMRFLADYVRMHAPVDTRRLQDIVNRVTQEGSVRICDVLALPEASSQILWWLVAQRRRVFCDQDHERVFESDAAEPLEETLWDESLFDNLDPGTDP